MHRAQHEQYDAELVTDQFNSRPSRLHLSAGSQGERHIADVDEIKADHKQVIDGIRQLTVAVEGIDEKTTAVVPERLGHPDRHGQTDSKICDIADNDVH